ncbi:sensor histidine kinase KdpD [Patulibacter sp.]|uniref:sensor histidine kinase n=1 Tax=Patulibacter sp. TaxID=1912859 RepID=UPI002726F7E4|nr:ATP-binding protein [Patulibacter sp.]MDO9409700.1 ATP-binding protein [Patulibacter sp.]
MSRLLLAGWLLAVGSAVLLLLARRSAMRSTERVVRACHELRGPLQNVMLALGGPDDEARRPPLRALAVELTRATRAVEDLAAATAGGAARDEVRRIDLVPLVRDLVAVHDVAARTRGRRVVLAALDAEATVLGDRDRLAQAIGNLVRNAVEHGQGTVRVGVGHGPGCVHVEVADEGHGLRVPIDRLVHGPRRGRRGRGMRIVAEALGAHGGRLRSAPSAAGARMVAELPAARSRAVVR